MLQSLASEIARGALLALLLFSPACAQTFQLLYSFSGGKDGWFPDGPLLLDSSGNLLGTTQYGGGSGCRRDGCGTVFKFQSGAERVLYVFHNGSESKGALPESGVIEDAHGTLFGTTPATRRCHKEQQSDCGSVFKLAPDGRVTALVVFDPQTQGADPSMGLIQDQEENLYGTAQTDGPYGHGTVYKVTRHGKFTLMYAFVGGSDGSAPFAPLLEDASGNLYGTTVGGGGSSNCGGSDYGCGTVFKLTPKGKESVLYAFQGGSDGSFPESGLLMDQGGNLYGTTQEGGAGCSGTGCGTVYKLATDGIKTILYAFGGGSDGGYPLGNLVMDSQGNLFGAAEDFGSGGDGVIYEIAAVGTFTVLHSFSGSDGSLPVGGLIMGPNDTLYGTTAIGGTGTCYSFGCGTIFSLQP